MKPTFLLAPTLLLAMAFPAAAEIIPLNVISDYFNGLRTAEAAFTQSNSDGSVSTGTLYIKRPGRMRFEYDPPNKALVIAGGGQVAIFDDKSNTGPEQYPLRRTPLSVILRRNVDLGNAGMVVGHQESDGNTIVSAQDPEHPDAGIIHLVFANDPVRLVQWVIMDQGGGQTSLQINEMRLGGQISARLFNIPQEVEARGLN